MFLLTIFNIILTKIRVKLFFLTDKSRYGRGSDKNISDFRFPLTIFYIVHKLIKSFKYCIFMV